jgi:anti-sigma28 factor (negative regulator of flagellin synthesis)
MKIDGNSLPTPPSNETPVRPQSAQSEAYAISPGASGTSRAVSQAVGQGLAAQRSTHLAAIKASLADGTYKPDPQKIADGILDTVELDAALTDAANKA